MLPKILVGCPTHEVKSYCLGLYAKAVKSLTYKNFDIALVDNSPTEDYAKRINSFGLKVIKGLYFDTAAERIITSRNILRDYALQNNYDYLLSLEQDNLPPPDVIERLLAHNKKIIAGVYFNLQKNLNGEVVPLAMLWTSIEGNTKFHLPEELIFDKPGLYKVAGCALGCTLIARDVLEKIEFRHGKTLEEGWDDVFFSKDAAALGYEIFADTSVFCQHATTPEGKWVGIKKF